MNYHQHRSRVEVLNNIENTLLDEVQSINESFHVSNISDGAYALRMLLNYGESELEIIDDITGLLDPQLSKALPRNFKVLDVLEIPVGLRIRGVKHLWNV